VDDICLFGGSSCLLILILRPPSHAPYKLRLWVLRTPRRMRGDGLHKYITKNLSALTKISKQIKFPGLVAFFLDSLFF
jgi:hypothetical protein